jgi:regulator of PEP synthase PpsR (kinase-PPPase family)
MAKLLQVWCALMNKPLPAENVTNVFVVSGGPGATGRLLLDTLLAQFPGCEVSVTYYKDLRSSEHLERIVVEAKEQNALVIHSLVDQALRTQLATRTQELGLETHDVFGELLEQLAQRFGQPPLAAPGRYRALRRDYYERIDAIEFAIEHDDSQNLHSIDQAEIVLVGVSRTGKTPLSMYLAMHGWKTANVSFIPDIPWPSELSNVDHGRIVGLSIDRERLLAHRKQRSAEVGLGRNTPYNNEEALFHELEALHAAFKQHRLPVIDVTEKPLETTAHEVIQLVTRALGEHVRRS